MTAACRKSHSYDAMECILGILIERTERIVQHQHIWPMQYRAGESEPLALAVAEYLVPALFLVQSRQEVCETNVGKHTLDIRFARGRASARIGDRVTQRTEREVRLLRHDHQLGLAREFDPALAPRPQARHHAGQDRLSGARIARDVNTLAETDRKIGARYERAALLIEHAQLAEPQPVVGARPALHLAALARRGSCSSMSSHALTMSMTRLAEASHSEIRL